jgi:uncharacterized protein DUF4249
MKTAYPFLIAIYVMFVLTSCETEYTPKPSGELPEYVVEGYIESGDNPLPPYVLLTRTFDFYGEITPDQFTESFVHDADVRISDGEFEVVLQEVCFLDLDSTIREQIAEQFGFDADSLAINFCVYLDVLNQVQAQQGKTYNLKITVGEDIITASTRMPNHVPLDSLRFAPPPGDPNDTLAQLILSISDPPGVKDFYRYFVANNDGPLETGFSSVEEDLFFDGLSFEFQLFNPETESGDVEPAEFGLYFVGDTVTLKWCTIDEASFDFWNTLEYSSANQGPFSNYTRIQSNVNGALGVWGGYGVSYYTLPVEY